MNLSRLYCGVVNFMCTFNHEVHIEDVVCDALMKHGDATPLIDALMAGQIEFSRTNSLTAISGRRRIKVENDMYYYLYVDGANVDKCVGRDDARIITCLSINLAKIGNAIDVSDLIEKRAR